jgi:hypothetical protein
MKVVTLRMRDGWNWQALPGEGAHWQVDVEFLWQQEAGRLSLRKLSKHALTLGGATREL